MKTSVRAELERINTSLVAEARSIRYLVEKHSDQDFDGSKKASVIRRAGALLEAAGCSISEALSS